MCLIGCDGTATIVHLPMRVGAKVYDKLNATFASRARTYY